MKKSIIAVWMIAARLSAAGYVCAVGGGSENDNSWSDEPYRWMVQKAGAGATLILHYADGSPWLERYFTALGAASATSLVIGSSAAANDSAVFRQISAAKLIFLRGGDQFQYVKLWRNSLAEQAILQVFEHGGVIGGSSAGLAVLGGVDYIASRNSARSLDCLLNPRHPDITLTDDFLPLLPGVLFDSHFTARGRLGRLLAFAANWQTTRFQDLTAIGVDEHTALCVEPNGSATVMGAGSVTILHTNADTAVICASDRPLHLADVTAHLLTRGFGFDLTARQLLEAPPSAKPITPVPDDVPLIRSRLFLHAGSRPQDAELALRQITSAGKPILLLTGRDDAGFADALFGLGASIETHALNRGNIASPELAAKIRSNDCLILAGLTSSELTSLLPFSSSLAQALREKLGSDALLLIAGEAVSAIGARFFTNLTADRYNLQDGKLTAQNGLALLPNTQVIIDAFSDDNMDENRIGGFFLAARRTLGRNLLLPKNGAVEITDNKLKSMTAVPALILDCRAVTHTDSSTFRVRPGAAPRQSTALINGVLHCLSSADSVRYDIRSGKLSSGVAASPTETMPHRLDLRIYPNPADRFVNFSLPMQDASASSELLVYNLLGQQIARLMPMIKDGSWIYHWPSTGQLPAGHYIARSNQTFSPSRSFIIFHR